MKFIQPKRLVVVALVALVATACSSTPRPLPPLAASPTPRASALPEPSPSPIDGAVVVAAQPPPPEIPISAVAVTPVPAAKTRAPATPTPSPDPAVWRIEGVVFDDATRLPIADVCVVLGPAGCRPGSPRTDSRGVYAFDAPQVPTIFYDFFFVKDGYWTVWFRIRPEGPSVYNLALTRR